MARFRGGRYLSCFYCGRRSGLEYDGLRRDFVCVYCDATNYLDEHGDITDPPVATDSEAAPAPAATTQYAVPRASSPVDKTFCQTCLKNQHLFTKSLAQYLPDDPADPDYERLERNYYRYRRGLEERYPQVCDECAARVEHRIRQAGYTAKTDHLRRMMDRSRARGRARPTKSATALDWASVFGRVVWHLGFALEMLWHAAAASALLQRAAVAAAANDGGMHDPDGAAGAAGGLLGLALPALARATAALSAALPANEALVRWSVAAACASAWWNPHFVQMSRGFTRHLLGFTQWYSFQGLVVFFRVASRRLLAIEGARRQAAQAQLSAHAAMAAVMALLYVLAGRSIRVDTSPLFATDGQPPLTSKATSAVERRERQQQDSRTLSELFEDALEPADAAPSGQIAAPAATPTRRLEQQVQQVQQHADEMDWSPVAPQHRALAPQLSPIRSGRAFGAASPAPAQPAVGNPFRQRVPAAPVNPARRLRNPPHAPEPPRSEPAASSRDVFVRKRPAGGGNDSKTGQASGVEFRQPKFFAPEKDDASSLADLLNQSFSLSQEEGGEGGGGEEEKEDRGTDRWKHGANKAAAGRSTGGDRGSRGGVGGASPPPPSRSRPVQLYAAAGLLLVWAATLLTAMPHRLEVRTALLAVAGMMALRRNGEAADEERQGAGAAAYLLSALGVAELAAVCWVASEAWKGGATVEAETGRYGAGVLAVMLAHEAAAAAAAAAA